MNDTARLAAHRELETEGSTTPAQSRSLPLSLAVMDPTRFCTAASQSRGLPRAVDDHPRPWVYAYDMVWGTYSVRDADGATIATGLSQRDAKLIAGAPDMGALAQQFCDDLDRALTRVGL